MAQQPPLGQGPPHYRGFAITLRHTTIGRTPLDEWSARHRDLYLTTHNKYKRQIFMPSVGFKPHNPSKRAAADPRLRPCGHWDRPINNRSMCVCVCVCVCVYVYIYIYIYIRLDATIVHNSK